MRKNWTWNDNKLCNIVHFRTDDFSYDLLKERADKANMSVGEYTRQIMMKHIQKNAKINIVTQTVTINKHRKVENINNAVDNLYTSDTNCISESIKKQVVESTPSTTSPLPSPLSFERRGGQLLIGLHDAERDHMPKKTFPNYALMKISDYHKALGDDVEWWIPFKKYDKVYSSKVFDFTPVNPYLPPDTIKGGTGYDVTSVLPPVIDAMYPDYTLYPTCDHAIGFITRGCPNKCNWCVVPKKEGDIKPYQYWWQITRPTTDKLILMDNNILACEHGIQQLDELSRTIIKIDINQGMDARLANDDHIIKILSKIKWLAYVRFSCDTDSQVEPIIKVAEKLKAHGISMNKLFIYFLVQKDIDLAYKRIMEIYKHIPHFKPYAQPEQNHALGIVANRDQKNFARFIYGNVYKKIPFREFKY